MGYKFNDRICVIEIEDVKYRVFFQKALVENLNSSKEILADMHNSGIDDNEKICAAFDSAIDGILGKGSAEKIVSGRFPDAMERYSVLKYIYEEITAFFGRIAGECNVQRKAKNYNNRRRKNSR